MRYSDNDAYTERKYVCIQYTLETQALLRAWAIDYGFNLEMDYDGNYQDAHRFDFHTTIYYTKSWHPIFQFSGIFNITRSEASAVGFDYLGDEGAKNIPVMSVNSDKIKEIRKYYKNHGFEDPWPTYKPHISLSYDRNNPIDIGKIELPSFKLEFDLIKVSRAEWK